VGVLGESGQGIGVHGRSQVGTGIKAEGVHPEEGGFGTAFEAVGPVKFSTSGLADVAASTDRVTVNPGVPISPQSKVLAMLQGNSGNKATVEHIEVNPEANTFQVVLTRIPARPVQIAWFLMSCLNGRSRGASGRGEARRAEQDRAHPGARGAGARVRPDA
jgi:hypothetical protein